MWRRNARSAADDLAAECEAFLAGRYLEYLKCRGHPIPAWAWTNPLAHAPEEQLRNMISTGGEAMGPAGGWLHACCYVAGELLDQVLGPDHAADRARDQRAGELPVVLAAVLQAEHPDLAGPTAVNEDLAWSKELHFFDDRFSRGLDWYRALFPLALTRRIARAGGGDLVAGEATPYYLFHPAVPERMAASLPEVRLIALLRDPVQRRQNDHFAVLLDTFHDRRNAYLFYSNPIGGISDSQITDEGPPNNDWNTIWAVKTGRFEGGWTVEMAIPFKSLRYRSGTNQTWGLQIRRSIRSVRRATSSSPSPSRHSCAP